MMLRCRPVVCIALCILICMFFAPSLPLHDGAHSERHSSSSGLLAVAAAKLADCCCSTEAVDIGNDDSMYQKLQKLRTFSFFRIFKVDLHSTCPFWKDNPQCARRNCAVCDECSKDEIPESPFGESSKSNSDASFDSFPLSGGAFGSSVDRTMLNGFKGWAESDECQWIAPDNPTGGGPVYINLQLNPEGYTGYDGDEAHRIWRAIYEQNCFNGKLNAQEQPAATTTTTITEGQGADGTSASPVVLDNGVDLAADNDGLMRPIITPSDFNNFCFEQRVFYRLISGLHASISSHISNAFPVNADVDPFIDLHAPEHCALIAPNLSEFERRVLNFPDRITNLYFAFVFMLRAVNKASDILRTYNYSSSVSTAAETVELSRLVNETLDSSLISSCSADASFDEETMFASPQRGPYLKSQLRSTFRNISKIMDCVGCEKCKLHGKLQILGLGTALRIMFQQEDAMGKRIPLKLERNEIMALIVTLSKFSHALQVTKQMKILKEIEEMEKIQKDIPVLLQPKTMGPIVLVAMSIATILCSFLLAQLCRRRGPTSEISRSRRNSFSGGIAPPPPAAAEGALTEQSILDQEIVSSLFKAAAAAAAASTNHKGTATVRKPPAAATDAVADQATSHR